MIDQDRCAWPLGECIKHAEIKRLRELAYAALALAAAGELDHAEFERIEAELGNLTAPMAMI